MSKVGGFVPRTPRRLGTLANPKLRPVLSQGRAAPPAARSAAAYARRDQSGVGRVAEGAQGRVELMTPRHGWSVAGCLRRKPPQRHPGRPAHRGSVHCVERQERPGPLRRAQRTCPAHLPRWRSAPCARHSLPRRCGVEDGCGRGNRVDGVGHGVGAEGETDIGGWAYDARQVSEGRGDRSWASRVRVAEMAAPSRSGVVVGRAHYGHSLDRYRSRRGQLGRHGSEGDISAALHY